LKNQKNIFAFPFKEEQGGQLFFAELKGEV
jgi:hypothetical protein